MSFRNEIRYCPKQDFCYEGIKTLSLFKLFLLLPDVLIGLSSYFLHSRKKKSIKYFFFFSDILHFLHYSCVQLFYLEIFVFGFVFLNGETGLFFSLFSGLSPLSLLLSPFFGPFRVLNSSILGKVLLIVIGQYSQ